MLHIKQSLTTAITVAWLFGGPMLIPYIVISAVNNSWSVHNWGLGEIILSVIIYLFIIGPHLVLSAFIARLVLKEA